MNDCPIGELDKEHQLNIIVLDLLPVKRNISDEQLISLGFVLGPKVSDFLTEGKIPLGWKKEAGAYPSFIRLIDDKGRTRGSLFIDLTPSYPYTDLLLNRRYGSYFYETDETKENYQFVIKDSGIIIKKLGVSPRGSGKNIDTIRRKGKEWLNRHYPDWKNKVAYW
jgi:hypothetical protein